eukprot:m.15346 g.15346  ORF g.15346 m.15346 type:complete len:208 (-) comp5364_c0_seq2:103-726(-)
MKIQLNMESKYTTSLVIVQILLWHCRCNAMPTMGMGMGMGMGGMGGMAPCGTMAECRVIMDLFEAGAGEHLVQRQVTLTENGYKSNTTSMNASIVNLLHTHVQSMEERVKTDNPINTRDPLFAALFEHTKDITLKVNYTSYGVEVEETGANDCTTALLQEHAGVVSKFVTVGMEEMMEFHKVPTKCPGLIATSYSNNNMMQKPHNHP